MAASRTRSYAMAAEAAAEIVSQKLKILLSNPEWVGCPSMEALVKGAKAKLAKIQEIFSQEELPKSMEWSGRLLQAMYNAEVFIDKFHLKVARQSLQAPYIATRPFAALVHKYMLWRDLSNLVKAMKDLCPDQYSTKKKEAGGERKQEPASSSSRVSASWEGQKLARLINFWDQQASMNFLCHETKKERIKKPIREGLENIRGISIWGKQGAGKTFFARWVYREAMYLGFHTRVWVHVTANMDTQEFLFEILKQVDKLARDVMDFNEIRRMLSQKFAKLKSLLIVLDDLGVSNVEILSRLMMIVPHSSKCLFITTTQDWMLARQNHTVGQEPIKLGDLCDKERQSMLAKKLPYALRSALKDDDILKRCPALPLSISLLGGLLSNAGANECAVLGKSVSEMKLSDLLQLTYHRLPVHLKPCFIYMALFPVACPILTRRLVRLWLAEGLLDSHCCDGERKRTPEEVGETFILELAARNVIDVVSWRADGSPKACQMLTSLYDMIRQVVSTGFIHIHASGKSEDGDDCDPTGEQQRLPAQLRENKVHWLAEHMNIVRDGRSDSYLNLNLSHVRSFLSFYLRRGKLTKDISTLLRKMTSKTDYGLLRVLDLEGVYKPSLQGVLRKLVLLRYLGLRSTVLDSIPREVVDLHYLETLDIKHTNITSLPSSLWKARNLRHLHLSWFYINLKTILEACRDNVMALTKLQTLSGLVISEVNENLMTGHMDSLTTLTKLKLFLKQSDRDTSGAAWKTVADWISFKLTNLQSLTLGVIKKDNLAEEAQPTDENIQKKEARPVKMGPIPKLSLAEQHHELLELYLQGQLNKPIWTQLLPGSLRVLTLSGSKVETDMMPVLGNLLRNLRTFRLLANSFQCKSMKFIRHGFPSVVILKIWKLPRLKNVFIKPGAMPHLKELELRHLESLETVDGIEKCNELENICVISQNDALVTQLKNKIGEKNLHVEIDTGRPGSMDDEEDDKDKKGEMTYAYLQKDTKGSKSKDEDGSDDDNTQ